MTTSLAPSIVATLRGWPARRWAAAAVLVGPALALVVAAGGPWSGPVAAVLSVASALLASLVLASYVPRAGRRPELGCSPCAAVAAGTVLGAVVLRDSAPGDVGIALVAVGLLAFGLAQRLTQGATCTTG